MMTFAIPGRRATPGWGWLLAAMVVAGTVAAGCTTPSSPQPTPTDGGSAVTSSVSSAEPGTGLIAPDGSLIIDAAPGGGGSGGTPVDQPAVVTAPWLAGAMIEGGLVVPGLSGLRWHGPAPGEHAEIYDDGYRYFGADGSAVECTSAGACVGVFADGSVVVLAEREGLRRLYGPDGSDLGLFTAEGDPVAPDASGDDEPDADTDDETDGESAGDDPAGHEPEATETAAPVIPDIDRETALADSAVNVAGLVNAMTLRAPFAGGVTGDPHVVTAGGIRYSTQGIGQFIARAGDPDRRIQLEFSLMPHRTDVSIVTGAVIATGSDAISITHTGMVTIDGSTQVPMSAFDQLVLADGVAIGRWPADETGTGTVVIWWPDGSEVTARTHGALGMTLVAAMPLGDELSGLFGDGSGELSPRNGRAGGSTDAFVATWRATGSDSLFADPAAGSSFGSPPHLEVGAQKVAADWCRVPALTRSQDVAACAFDIAITGDTAFLAGHITLATAVAAGRAPGVFAARWPALTAGVRANADPLPTGGHIRTQLDAHTSRSYRLTVDRPGSIVLTHSVGCPAGATPPGLDEASVRVFDAYGHAVSDRAPWCGQLTARQLPAGDYLIVGATGAEAAPLTVDITLL